VAAFLLLLFTADFAPVGAAALQPLPMVASASGVRGVSGASSATGMESTSMESCLYVLGSSADATPSFLESRASFKFR
jgi:hypothetical protein